MLLIRGSAAGLVQWAILAVLLIGPAGLAGTWDWARGWQFLIGYGVVQQISVAFLALYAPASLEARLHPMTSAEQPAEDRFATLVIIASLTVALVFIPLDATWLYLLPSGGIVAGGSGFGLLLAGYGIIIWTLLENRFAVPIVQDQSGAGQVVVDTGPYAFVRHPMYAGALILLAGMGLFLGSLASLVFVPVVAMALRWRVRIEERMLLEVLPGYQAYCDKVRWRIAPLIW